LILNRVRAKTPPNAFAASALKFAQLLKCLFGCLYMVDMVSLLK